MSKHYFEQICIRYVDNKFRGAGLGFEFHVERFEEKFPYNGGFLPPFEIQFVSDNSVCYFRFEAMSNAPFAPKMKAEVVLFERLQTRGLGQIYFENRTVFSTAGLSENPAAYLEEFVAQAIEHFPHPQIISDWQYRGLVCSAIQDQYNWTYLKGPKQLARLNHALDLLMELGPSPGVESQALCPSPSPGVESQAAPSAPPPVSSPRPSAPSQGLCP
jgi:hypothetical protein